MSARLVALLVAAALVLPGCAWLTHGDTADTSGPLTVVLFDVSRSTEDPAIRARYLDAFERVLEATADARGTVVGDVIDDSPLAHSTYPIDATFAACDPLTDNRLECEARAVTTHDEAVASARAILSGAPSEPGTDIHDGVELAARVFAAYPEASSRSLVLLSDMVEHSRQLRPAEPGFDGTSALTALTRSGSVPDLHGVGVYVVGAGVTSTNELPAGRILAIQRFWQSFFTAAGADLPSERYGAALVRFP